METDTEADMQTQQTRSDSFLYMSDGQAFPQASPVLTRPPALHRRTSPEKPSDPDLIPPPSIHDDYVSKFIVPIISPVTEERPGLPRSNSAPGVPHINTNTAQEGLQPSPLRETKQGAEGKPIFEIFNADFNTTGSDLVRSLKGHLEDVLRVQEEIGRMHLSLEKVGLGEEALNEKASNPPTASPRIPTTPGTPRREAGTASAPSTAGSSRTDEAVAKREKGVDEIMDKLGELSTRLQTYHSLGTPRLSFPQSGNTPISRTRLNSLDPAMAKRDKAKRESHPPSFSPVHPSPLRQMRDREASRGSELLGKRSSSSIGLSGRTTVEEAADDLARHRDDLHLRERTSLRDIADANELPVSDVASKRGEQRDEYIRTRPRSGSASLVRPSGETFEMVDRTRPW